MNMQLSRDYVLVSLSGLSIEFKKDQPTHVPKRLIREAIALGAVAVEDDKAAEAQEKAFMDAETKAAATRLPKIEEAVKLMVARNKTGDITAGGKPNLKTLQREVGFEVTADELDPIWTQVKAELQT